MNTDRRTWYVEDEMVRERMDERVLFGGPRTPEDFGEALRAYLESFVREELLDMDPADWTRLGERAMDAQLAGDRLEQAVMAVIDRVFHDQRELFRKADVGRRIEEDGFGVVRDLATSVDPVTVPEIERSLRRHGAAR